jgi:hypothetical protein
VTVTLAGKSGKYGKNANLAPISSLSRPVFAENTEVSGVFFAVFFLTRLSFQASSIHSTGLCCR